MKNMENKEEKKFVVSLEEAFESIREHVRKSGDGVVDELMAFDENLARNIHAGLDCHYGDNWSQSCLW